MRTFNLFISHSWAYADQYQRLLNLLRARSYFRFKDYSVPPNDPLHTNGTVTELRQAIRQKMQPCGVILVMAGVYATHSRWMREEIDLAKKGFSAPKPIIGIKPRGNELISAEVRKAAATVVGWNTESVVQAIRDQAP